MVNKEQQIQDEVNKTLGLLDSWEQPTVNPFFYGKLQHRMSNSVSQPQGVFAIVLPKIAIATLMVLFLCNIFTLVSPSNSTGSTDTGLTNFAEQYNISISQ